MKKTIIIAIVSSSVIILTFFFLSKSANKGKTPTCCLSYHGEILSISEVRKGATTMMVKNDTLRYFNHPYKFFIKKGVQVGDSILKEKGTSDISIFRKGQLIYYVDNSYYDKYGCPCSN